MLLEHFQFDNSKINRKGSIQSQTIADTERKFDSILKHNNDFTVVNERVNKCGKFYVENLTRQFNSHAKNIENYKTEIQEEIKLDTEKFIVGFIIEDSSPLGSIYCENGVKCLNLLYSKEFLDLFENTNNLDFVIFAMTGSDENKTLSFVSRNTLAYYREHQIEVTRINKFLFEDTFCMGGLYLSPKRKK